MLEGGGGVSAFSLRKSKFTQVRMTILKKLNNESWQGLVWGGGEFNIHTLLVGNVKSVWPLERSLKQT